jgi:hypothetical protein
MQTIFTKAASTFTSETLLLSLHCTAVSGLSRYPEKAGSGKALPGGPSSEA